MRSLARVVLAAVCLSLLSAGASTVLASAPTSVLVGQTAMEPNVGKDLKSRLVAAMRTLAGKGRADAATGSKIERFHVNDGSDCLIKSYETRPASNVASADYIQGYWKSMWFSLEGWNAGSIHVDVGMVITGYSATANWGPNCYFQWNLPAIFGGGITWCGVWNNGNWYTEPGTKYYVFVWPNVWATRTGYMRYCVEGHGVSCYPWGSFG